MYYLAEILRLMAEALRWRGRCRMSLGAERCLVEALEVSRGQEAKFWELRVALALAKLWAGRGRRA